MIEYHSILIPTDFSNCSAHVMEYALDLATRTKARVHLLYVVEPIDTFATVNGIEQSVYFDMVREVRDSAQEKMQALEADLRGRGFEVESTIRDGKPFEVITEYAHQEKISLICISTHGRSGLNHLLLGSTTEKVLRKAECPVLVVRCQPSEK